MIVRLSHYLTSLIFQPKYKWLLLLPLLGFIACKEDKPEACVNWGGETVVPYQLISFESCNEQADSYLWDFGDGATSTEAAPTHQFTAPGTYSVTFTVNEGGESSTFTFTVNVAAYRLNTLTLQSISETRSNGSPWDEDSTAPDVLLRYVVDTLEAGPYNNLTNDSLPLSPNVETITAGSELWTVALFDEDEFLREQMVSWGFNVYEQANGADSIALQKDGFEVVLRFVRE